MNEELRSKIEENERLHKEVRIINSLYLDYKGRIQSAWKEGGGALPKIHVHKNVQ